MKRRKHKGYILFVVIIITMILISVTMTVTMLGTAQSNDTVKDIQRNKSYYLAYSALEMVYSTLTENKVSPGTPGSVNYIEAMGTTNFNNEKDKIIPSKEISIRNQNSVILGYADIYADLKKTSDNRWYYRIVATGKIEKNDDPKKATDTHTLTMIVFKDDANNPKVYEGDKR